MSEKTVVGTDANFAKEVLAENEKLTVVDFWAPWCGPCKMIAPHLDALAAERPDVKVVKLNVDEEQQVAAQFAIRSIPTMMIFKGGQLVSTKVGALSKSDLQKWVDSNKG
jgi:thioredoxin 1